jgi:cyclic lactone autoinducer peptide
MIRAFQRKAVYKLASALLLLAVFVVDAVPSVLFVHQPEVPEELLK